MVGSPKPLSKAVHSPTAIPAPAVTGWTLVRKRKGISCQQVRSNLYFIFSLILKRLVYGLKAAGFVTLTNISLPGATLGAVVLTNIKKNPSLISDKQGNLSKLCAIQIVWWLCKGWVRRCCSAGLCGC